MTGNSFGSRWIVGAVTAAGLALGGASVAKAQEGEWYVGANMPLMFIDDTDSVSTGSFQQTQMGPQGLVQHEVSYSATVRTEHDTGFKLGAVLGHHLDSNLRVEGEIFFARAKVSKLTHSSITVPARSFTLQDELAIPVSGSADQFGALVNVWYDFDTGDNWTPYVGGGLGLIRVDRGGLSYETGAVAQAVATALAQQAGAPPGFEPPIPEVPELSGSDTAFAYQIGAGVGYALSDTATLQIGYRLQMVDGLSFSGANDVATVGSDTNLRIHFLEIGIRQLF